MISKISINCNYIWYKKKKKIDYFKLIKNNRDISYNATLKQTRSTFYRNANSKREICKRKTNQQNRELPTNWIKAMGQHANGQATQQQLLLKRAQWHNSNNDFPFFASIKDPKNEKPFVAALFATVCRASSVFFLRARCPLKLTTRLEISYSHIKKKKKKK